MQQKVCDVIVVGSGPAGRHAAIQASNLGAKVIMVEQSVDLGGDCLLTGTIPSKTFREAVLYLRGVRQRAFYGEDFAHKKDITAGDLRFRVRKVIEREIEVVRGQLERSGVEILSGRVASLKDQFTVHAKDAADREDPIEIKTKYIILTTGSSPRRAKGIPYDSNVIFDSDTIFTPESKLEGIPRSLIVIGAGVIGCEYACIFATLGCKVWLVSRRHELLPYTDETVISHLIAHMQALGVEFVWGRGYKRIEALPNNQAFIELDDGMVLEADALFTAFGRVADTSDLGLTEIGIAVDKYGLILVNELYQTSVPNIFAAGDVIGFPSLASTGAEQGRVAACYAMGKASRSRRDLFPLGIYAIPEISMVGRTEQELRESNVPYAVGIADYREIAKAGMVGGETGFLKLIFEPDNRHLLGVHIIGEQATELIHIGQAVMCFGGTIDYFVENVFNYPTFAETYKLAALNGIARLTHKQK